MALRQGPGVPQCNIVTSMPLATITLLCKQTTDNFRTHPPPELPMAPSIRQPVIICSSLYIASSEITADMDTVKKRLLEVEFIHGPFFKRKKKKNINFSDVFQHFRFNDLII